MFIYAYIYIYPVFIIIMKKKKIEKNNIYFLVTDIAAEVFGFGILR